MLSRKRSLSPDTDTKRTKIRLEEPTDVGQLSYPSPSEPIKTSVPFQQPSSLLTFSYTPKHELVFNDSALRYYVQPPQGADLNYGYDRWIRRPDERGRIDNLLHAVSKARSRMDANGHDGKAWLSSIGIISWRGVITKIFTAPYEERDAWELNVMFRNGTLYFEEHLSEDRLVEKNNIPPRQRIQMYYGYAFESYCTSDSQNSTTPNGWGGDVDTNVQWCSVVKTKLGDTRIIIGGEVDCVRGKFTSKTDNFVELKTSLTIRGPLDEARFEKKLLKFYFQSFLLGVPEIVVGFRTPKGQLSTVQTFKTMELPRLVRDKEGAWNPLVCLNWGKDFIDFLISIVTSHTPCETDDEPVWRVKFAPRSGVTATLLTKEGIDEVVNGEDRVGFLPKWYFDEVTELNSLSQRDETGTSSDIPLSRGVDSTHKDTLPSGWQI
ncbi:hypothetical protein QCA50_014452 [Cerrena zonata]|uniref:Decapping nuclease n=1 Tax=Cerrena zonata TaxID=2478898 RepID=A0AAW0FTM2_9APHY